MKRITRLVFLSALALCAATASYAQKFAYINSQQLIAVMPELETAQANLQKFTKDYQDGYEGLQVEYNNAVNDLSKVAAASDVEKNIKEKRANDLVRRIQEFEAEAEQKIAEEQQKLMAPILEKAREAIKKVAKAGGYTAVFDEAGGSLLYYDDVNMVNLLPAVKKELGIQDTPAAAAPAKK